MPESPLLQSFDLHGLALKNRVAMAPLTRSRAGKDRVPNELMAKYYAQRASAGMQLSEATTISSQANGWNESAGIYTVAHTAGWKGVIQSVHDAGGVFFCQLWHCGRASHPDFHGGELHVAPSAIKIEGDDIHTPEGKKPHETPRALETAEIAGVVADYKQAAQRAKEAGFDGIEIHSANGYLLDTFLQSKTNHRDDAYGGSIENRTRLLLEVLAAVTKVFPSNRVGVRLSPNGAFNDMGSPDYREQFLYAAGELDKLGVAYLHVMDGLGFGFHGHGEAITLRETRGVFNGTLMGNCGYTQATADAAIAAGDADLISFGRPYISNPDLVERFANEWPLADEAPVSTWYTPGEKGYADWPTYDEASA